MVWMTIPIIVTDFWFTDWAQKKFSSKSILVVSGLTSALFMLLMTLPIGDGPLLWACLFIIAFGIGCCMPLCPFFIAHKSRHELYGEVLAHDETLRTGTEAFATLIVGFLAAVFISFPIIVFAAAALVGTVLIALKPK